MRNGRGLIGVLLVGFLVLALAACSGSGGSGAEMATVSGRAVDDPVAGADVSVLDISGTVLATGTTDSDGYYAVEVVRADIADGFEVLVSGGTVNGEPFDGQLRSFFGSADDAGGANVTLVTSAAAALGSADPAADPLAGFFEAVALMERIGMVRAGEWAETEPGYVDLAALRSRVREMGLDLWLTRLAEDLADEALSPEMMAGFPHAHGGIVSVSMDAEQNRFSALPGDEIEAAISMDANGDGGGFSYEVAGGPDGLAVDADGRVTYALPADETEGRDIPFAIRVVNGETGFGREIAGVISVMAFGEVDNDGDGYTEEQGDCDDGNPAAYPGAAEICDDGVDQDCDGADAVCAELDRDGDGFTGAQGDCDDGNAAAYPGAEEICGDGVDQDCDGADAACPEDVDADEDGFTEAEGDCDDEDPARNPGAEDVCGDGVDQDCDGADAVCPTVWYKDADGDGYSDGATQESVNRPEGYAAEDELTATEGDCDDGNERIHPGAADVCGDGVDQDCSGSDATCYTPTPTPTPPQPSETTWYKDMDGDGYSDGTTQVAVGRPAGYYAASELIGLSGDCNENDEKINPEGVEFCGDDIDQDCSGEDSVCDLTGTVDVPETVEGEDIAVTNLKTYADIDENNLYETDKKSILLAANTNGDILYMAYPDQTNSLNLGADETAVSLILRHMPIFVSNENVVSKNIKEFILSYPEVQDLSSSIAKDVEVNGYFQIENVIDEYENAASTVVGDLMQYVDLPNTTERRRGVTTLGVPRYDVRMEIENYEKLDDDNYLVDVNVFSKVPIYLVGTLVDFSEWTAKPVDDAPYFFISPMNSTEFLQTFFFADEKFYRGDIGSLKKMGKAVSELYDIMSGDIHYTQTTWDSKKTSFQTVVSPEKNAFLFDGDSTQAAVVNSAYVILKGISVAETLVSGSSSTSGEDLLGDLSEIFEKLILDEEVLAKAAQCMGDDSCYLVEELHEIIWEKIIDVLVKHASFEAIKRKFGDEVLKRLKDVLLTVKFVKGAAHAIDKELVALSTERPDTYFFVIDTTPPEISATLVDEDAHFAFTYTTPFTLHELTGFRLYHSTDGTGWEIVGETEDMDNNELSVYDLSPGKHYFKATAYAGKNGITGAETEYSEIVEIPIGGTSITPPLYVLTNTGNGEVEIDWPDVENAYFYNIYCNFLDQNGMEQEVEITGITESFFLHQNLANGVTYNYRITAVGPSNQESNYSSIKSATPMVPFPALPEILSVEEGDGEVVISWEPAEYAHSYNIYMNTETWGWMLGDFTYGGMQEEVTSPFTYTGLENGVEYFFVVSAINDSGENHSVEKSATPGNPLIRLEAPSNIQTEAGDGQITLSWDAVDNATTYTVYQGSNLAVWPDYYEEVYANASSPFELTGLTNGTEYFFVVVAENATESSEPSNVVSVTPSAAATVPDAPVISNVSAGNGRVTLTWGAVDGATSYYIIGGASSGGAISITGITTSSYTMEDVENGVTYYLSVVAMNGAGESAPSDQVSATPTETTVGDTVTDSSGLGMTFVRIPAGTFMMGRASGEDGDSDELPQHQVTLTQDYYMMTTEVTNAQFVAFLNDVGQRGPTGEPWFETQSESSYSKILGNVGNFYVEAGYENHPVVEVSWYGAKALADWLTAREGKTYRLPTEAEWEYAARAGTQTPFAFGDCLGTDQANYRGTSPLTGCPAGEYRAGTVEVGTLGKNGWDLHDMHGNVYEWVEDQYHSSYDGAPTDGSAWVDLSEGSYRVLRGGSWIRYARYCRSAYRNGNTPSYRYALNGFRLALSPGQ